MSNNDQMSDSDYRWSDDSGQYRTLQKTHTSQDIDMRRQSLANQNINNKTYDNGQKLEKLEDQNINNKTYDNGQKLGKLEDQNIDSETDDNGQKLEKLEKSKKLEKPKMSEKSKKLGLEEQAITKYDIREIIKLLQQIATGVIELQGKKLYTYDDRGRETTRRGRALVYKYTNYYDVANTIKRVGSEDPQDSDSLVYNAERVYEVLERYSDIIHVINRGTGPLFVIVSHEGRTNFSKEAVIFPGEVKDYYHVYELRLRSPEVGLQYRVTEYLIMSVSQTSLIPIELASLHDVSLPEEDKDWLSEDIVPLISPTTFRIQVSASKTGKFFGVITKDEQEEVVLFNATSGPELIEDGVYVFELLVHKGDSVNFRYSADNGTIKILRVQEIDASTA